MLVSDKVDIPPCWSVTRLTFNVEYVCTCSLSRPRIRSKRSPCPEGGAKSSRPGPGIMVITLT